MRRTWRNLWPWALSANLQLAVTGYQLDRLAQWAASGPHTLGAVIYMVTVRLVFVVIAGAWLYLLTRTWLAAQRRSAR